MVDRPQINTGLLYGIVADAMPMEGRDFTIDASFDENRKPKLVIKPLTDVGKAFVPMLVARLTKPMGGEGVTVLGDGPVAQEVVTVRSLRQKVVEEATAARQAKLKEAEADRQAKYNASQEARKARIAKSGENAPASQEEVAANRAAHQAASLAWRLKSIDERIPKIRAAVDVAAKAAAEDDAKNGKDWTTDMDAPLTSLFDRQDVRGKLAMKENLVSQMAAHEFEIDDLRNRAVAVAKQYIIHRK